MLKINQQIQGLYNYYTSMTILFKEDDDGEAEGRPSEDDDDDDSSDDEHTWSKEVKEQHK